MIRDMQINDQREEIDEQMEDDLRMFEEMTKRMRRKCIAAWQTLYIKLMLTKLIIRVKSSAFNKCK